MESNKRAIKILVTLLLIVILLFLTEKNFLIKELRGAGISKYGNLSWTNKISLLVDDFEGLSGDKSQLEKEGFFAYGGMNIVIDTTMSENGLLASKTVLRAEWNGKENYGGWGKGIGKNMDMNTATDHLNFRIYVPKNSGYKETIKIMIEEDDNNDGILQQDKDDSWFYKLNIEETGKWYFVSIPLKDFSDGNEGGDKILNISRKGGIHTLIFSFEQTDKYIMNQKWYFDFICFTTEKVTDSPLKTN